MHSGFPERLGIVCWLDRWSLRLPLAHSERVIHARLVGKSIHTNRDLDLRIDSGCSRVLVHDIKALTWLTQPQESSPLASAWLTTKVTKGQGLEGWNWWKQPLHSPLTF